MNDNVIDIRDKSEEEIFEAYKKIGEETLILQEIWDNTKNFDDAMRVYEKLKENKNNENDISSTN